MDEQALNFFLRMLLGHLIGDFVLQPLWLAMAKRHGWRGLLIHVSVVTFATGVMVFNVIPNWLGWTAALFAIHLFIDQFRTFVFTDNSKGKGVFLFILDQTAHVLSIMLISWLATGWEPSMLVPVTAIGLSHDNLLIYIFSIVVFMTWVVPILEIELAVAIQSYNAEGPKKIVPINFSDRAMGAFERLSSLGLVVGSLGLVVPLVFIPRLYWLLRKDTSPDLISTFTKIGTSFVTVLFIAILL